jgi:DNA-binding PadR family transcriptional regulator
MPRVNKTKYALLGLLSRGPLSGYDIKKFTDFSVSHFWKENFGHIYPVLKRMGKEGLVTKQIETTEGKPNRNIYSITKSGTDEFLQWLSRPPEEHSIRNELLLKIFFGSAASKESIISMILTEKERHVKKREAFDAIEEMITTDTEYKDQPDRPYWLITLEYGKKMSDAIAKWCDEAIQMLEKL